MEGHSTPIPEWIVAVSALIAVPGLFVGLSLYLFPGTFIEGADFSLKWARYLSHMWAARQVAIAAVIAYSLVGRSGVMLQVFLIAYCLMNFQDILIGLTLGDLALPVGALIFGIYSGAVIFVLLHQERTKTVAESA